jgi:hypothetical protein
MFSVGVIQIAGELGADWSDRAEQSRPGGSI